MPPTPLFVTTSSRMTTRPSHNGRASVPYSAERPTAPRGSSRQRAGLMPRDLAMDVAVAQPAALSATPLPVVAVRVPLASLP